MAQHIPSKSDKNKPGFIKGVLTMKCPNCRKGHAFKNKSVFPLKECVKLVDNCEVCGQKMVSETNNGPGINYALTVIMYLVNLAWYWPIVGLSYYDNSIEIFICVSTLIIILLQPWTMRYSRILYLYMWVPYASNRHLDSTTQTASQS